MSETIRIEIETLARGLLKKDGTPRKSASEEELAGLAQMREANPDVVLWYETVEEAAEEITDQTRESLWAAFWNANPGARVLTTNLGRPRSSLRPSELRRANALLKEHGF